MNKKQGSLWILLQERTQKQRERERETLYVDTEVSTDVDTHPIFLSSDFKNDFLTFNFFHLKNAKVNTCMSPVKFFFF